MLFSACSGMEMSSQPNAAGSEQLSGSYEDIGGDSISENSGDSVPERGDSGMEAGSKPFPICSHGGGRFGQSLTAIAKLAPDALIGEGLAISYSGGSGMPDDVAVWLEENKAALQ